MTKGRIRIGTRKSLLALVQTDYIKDKIEKAFPDIRVEIVRIDTKGDQILDRSLTSFGGKGVFTAELEAELLSGAVDLAVHSAKDLPMDFPEGLGIGAVSEREDVRDVFATADGRKLADLPAGSIVGTSSLRRELQIRRINPGVTIRMLRGNVQTRIRKLKEGRYDGIILAAAGLSRLGLKEEDGLFFQYMEPEDFLPAAGQGILAVESRTGDETMKEILAAIHNEEAAALLAAERAFLKTIGGSCNAPAAAWCSRVKDGFRIRAMYAKDGIHASFCTLTGEAGEREQEEAAAALGRKAARELNRGKVYLVGAGPGDEDLLTRKGLALLRRADVVVYDSLASDSLLNEIRDDADLIYAGKRSSHHHLKQYETNELLIELAKEGKMVVRLKGGDPFIFGRGGEEARELREADIDFEIVPGISSSYAVPAYCGIPVTHRDYASSFHVITGHEGDHKKGANVLDYETLAREEGTLIFLMGLKNLPNIVDNLIRCGKDPDTPAGVLQEGTTAKQRVAAGTLRTIVEEVEKQGIRTPAISVVGPVVALREVLDWYGGRPLSGKRILVTGSSVMTGKLSPLLKEAGAEAISYSLIRTERLGAEALKEELRRIADYRWIVFTSANGVEAFFEDLREIRMDIRALSDISFAVIGDGTKKALESHGIYSDFMPAAYSSEDMAGALIPVLAADDKVLLLRAGEASDVLPEALKKAGIAYKNIPLYHTVRDDRKAEELKRMLPGLDYITFASGSAVKAFAAMAGPDTEVSARCISIGPVTTRTAEKKGIPIRRTASVYTAEGIVEAILQDVKEG